MRAALPAFLVLLAAGCDSQSQLLASRSDSTFGPIIATQSVTDMGSTTLLSFVFQKQDLPPIIRYGTNRQVVLSGKPAALGESLNRGWLEAYMPPLTIIPMADSSGYVYFLFQSDQGSRLGRVQIAFEPPFTLGALWNSVRGTLRGALLGDWLPASLS